MPPQGSLCGPTANVLIDRWFRDCVYTPWETLAFCIGLSSVLFWLVALCPQVVNNFLRHSVDGLSPWFLVQWLAGDTSNLLGCLLTGDQLATQTVTACYFVFADCLVISQYAYYQTRNRSKHLEPYCSDSDDSLHKPRFGYQNVVENSGNPATKTFSHQATGEGFGEVPSQQSCSVRNPGCITSSVQKGCKLKTTFVPEKRDVRGLCQDGTSHITPSEAEIWQPFLPEMPNLTDRCSSHLAINIHAKQTTRFKNIVPSRDPQIQISDKKHFLHSQVNCKQHCALISEERHRLRRLVLEYGLEYGPPAVSRCMGLHPSMVNEAHAALKLGCRKLQVPAAKAQLRAVLCFAGVMLLGFSSCLSFLSPHTRGLDASHSFVLGRKALISLVEEGRTPYSWRHYANWMRSNFLFLETPLISSTRRRLLSYSNSFLWARQLGHLLGWISSVLYLGSRISQLIKNKQRKSAEGLSLGMVTCAVLANMTYGVSILMRALSWEDFTGKAPWLVGSLGTVFLDLTLFTQAQYFNWRCKKGKLNEYTPLLA